MSDMPVVDAPTRTVGEVIDAIQTLKNARDRISEKVKAIDAQIDAQELVLLGLMDAQKMPRAAGNLARARVDETVVPKVEDWDAYWAYIRRNNAFELLERRPAAAAWREHCQNRRDHSIPGTVPFVKRKAIVTRES